MSRGATRRRVAAAMTLRRRVLGWTCAALLAVAGAARADYRLDSGDVLQITVYGEAEYPLLVSVDDGGVATLPLLGAVPARGLSLAELTQAIAGRFRDGAILRDPQVQVAVQQYRPYFISGAVARPGAYPYMPRLSVRQALAVAGGFQGRAFGGESPELTIADLSGERIERQIDGFRYRVQQQRLRAELSGSAGFELPDAVPPGIAAEVIAELFDTETSQMRERDASHARQIDDLRAVIAEAERQAELLQGAGRDLEELAQAQRAELQAATLARDRGLLTRADHQTQERSYRGYLSERAQVGLQQSRQQQELTKLRGEMEALETARRIEIISQIQEVQVAIAKTDNRLRSLEDKLDFVTRYGAHRSMEDLSSAVRITIHRPGPQGVETMPGTQDTPLQPDDIVEIAIQAEGPQESAAPEVR